jgi:hypothetical protein
MLCREPAVRRYPGPFGPAHLCQRHTSAIVSVMTHAAIGKRPLVKQGLAESCTLTIEERKYLWKWFIHTPFFETHKRFSRGRAKRLLRAMREKDAACRVGQHESLSPSKLASIPTTE